MKQKNRFFRNIRCQLPTVNCQTIKLCVVGCALDIAIPLSAQETLTLSQCRDLALSHNKELAAADKKIESAGFDVRTYRGNFFPNITANGMGVYSTADGSFGVEGGNLPVLAPNASTGQLAPNGSYAYFPGLNLDYKIGAMYLAGVQLEQPLYMGGKITAAYKMSKLGKEVADLNRDLTTTEVLVQTDEAYMLAVKAKEMKDVALKYKAVLEELQKNVQSAYNHGLKPQNDVMKVQVKLNESELALRKADNAFRLATMNLCHVIGKPLDSQIDVSSDFPEVEKTMGLQTADISDRPEYELLNKKVAVAEQQVKLNRSEMLPQIGVQGGYHYLHGLELNDQTLFKSGSFSALLNVSIPIYHFGERTNKVRSAKAKLEQARIEQADLNEKMLLELTQAANNLDEARLECELADTSLEQAEENMRMSNNQYKSGLETLSDNLEAQALWQQAYETRVESHFQLYLSYVKYMKAAGKLKK